MSNIVEEVYVKLLGPGAIIPLRATAEAAGYDLSVPNDDMHNTVAPNHAFTEPIWDSGGSIVHLIPGSAVIVDTHLAMEIPKGYEGQVRSRSGLGKKGVVVLQGVGTIDSDYRGPVKVMLHNVGQCVVPIQPGDRIAQIVFTPVFANDNQLSLHIANELTSTERGQGGFGSTGA